MSLGRLFFRISVNSSLFAFVRVLHNSLVHQFERTAQQSRSLILEIMRELHISLSHLFFAKSGIFSKFDQNMVHLSLAYLVWVRKDVG